MSEEVKPTMVDEAKAAAERLEAANKAMTDNIQKLEALKAERILSGNATAGQEPPKPKEETPQEYKERVMRGDLNEKEGKYF